MSDDLPTDLVTLDVDKPLFYHGPRIPLGDLSEGLQQVSYNQAFDLIAVADTAGVALYSGRDLVKLNANTGERDGNVKTGKPADRIDMERPLLVCCNDDVGSNRLGLLCASRTAGHLSFYALDAVAAGRGAGVVSSVALDGEELAEVRWRERELLCVCVSGRVFVVDPQCGAATCVHDVVDFAAACAGPVGGSDFALLGGAPAGGADSPSGLWSLDLASSEAWPLSLEGVPPDYEDQLLEASLRGVLPLPGSSKGQQGGAGCEAVCVFVLEDEEGPATIQAILEVSSDFRRATLKAISFNDIFVEEVPDRITMHSLWVPDWSLLILGLSCSADVILLSCHPSCTQGQDVPCGWVGLAPPEGKQLGCPSSEEQESTTSLRGLCFLTNFHGEVGRGRGPADAPRLEAPPVVLLAASDGTLGMHFCDHHLDPPRQAEEPSPQAAGGETTTAKGAFGCAAPRATDREGGSLFGKAPLPSPSPFATSTLMPGAGTAAQGAKTNLFGEDFQGAQAKESLPGKLACAFSTPSAATKLAAPLATSVGSLGMGETAAAKSPFVCTAPGASDREGGSLFGKAASPSPFAMSTSMPAAGTPPQGGMANLFGGSLQGAQANQSNPGNAVGSGQGLADAIKVAAPLAASVGTLGTGETTIAKTLFGCAAPAASATEGGSIFGKVPSPSPSPFTTSTSMPGTSVAAHGEKANLFGGDSQGAHAKHSTPGSPVGSGHGRADATKLAAPFAASVGTSGMGETTAAMSPFACVTPGASDREGVSLFGKTPSPSPFAISTSMSGDGTAAHGAKTSLFGGDLQGAQAKKSTPGNPAGSGVGPDDASKLAVPLAASVGTLGMGETSTAKSLFACATPGVSDGEGGPLFGKAPAPSPFMMSTSTFGAGTVAQGAKASLFGGDVQSIQAKQSTPGSPVGSGQGPADSTKLATPLAASFSTLGMGGTTAAKSLFACVAPGVSDGEGGPLFGKASSPLPFAMSRSIEPAKDAQANLFGGDLQGGKAKQPTPGSPVGSGPCPADATTLVAPLAASVGTLGMDETAAAKSLFACAASGASDREGGLPLFGKALSPSPLTTTSMPAAGTAAQGAKANLFGGDLQDAHAKQSTPGSPVPVPSLLQEVWENKNLKSIVESCANIRSSLQTLDEDLLEGLHSRVPETAVLGKKGRDAAPLPKESPPAEPFEQRPRPPCGNRAAPPAVVPLVERERELPSARPPNPLKSGRVTTMKIGSLDLPDPAVGTSKTSARDKENGGLQLSTMEAGDAPPTAQSARRDGCAAPKPGSTHTEPARELRASLYAQLRVHAARQPRRRVKRSDHLALDRGALDLCGETRPQSEIDTPTFGSRNESFGATPPKDRSPGERRPTKEDGRQRMPPPALVPPKAKGSQGDGRNAVAPGPAEVAGAAPLFSSPFGASTMSAGGLGGLGGITAPQPGGEQGGAPAAVSGAPLSRTPSLEPDFGAFGKGLFSAASPQVAQLGVPPGAEGAKGAKGAKGAGAAPEGPGASVPASAPAPAPASASSPAPQAGLAPPVSAAPSVEQATAAPKPSVLAGFGSASSQTPGAGQPGPAQLPAVSSSSFGGALGLGSSTGAFGSPQSSGGSSGSQDPCASGATSASFSAGGLFGSQATGGAFSAAGGGAFGAGQAGGATSAPTSASSGSIFGSPTSASFGGMFGAATSASSGGAFGTPTSASSGGAFGMPTFASSGGVFGTPTSASSGSAFGAPTSASSGGTFGVPTSASSGSAFGASASASSGGAFGAPTSASSGGAFGALQGSGLGGASASASPFGQSSGGPGGSTFGAAQQAGQLARSPVEEYREKITGIYSQHNPNKLGEVENLLVKYKGKEQELYLKICKKYNVSPAPPNAAAAGTATFSSGFGTQLSAAAPGAAFSGGGSLGSNASPFGAPQSQGSGNPFGAGIQGFGSAPFAASSSSASPFGAAPASPFGGPGAQPAFASASGPAGPQPTFGSPSPLGGASPFGGAVGGAGASPFGAGASPFGAGASASGASPFGAGASVGASPFGAAAGAGAGAGASPFGAAATAASPFAGAASGGGFAALSAQAQAPGFGGFASSAGAGAFGGGGGGMGFGGAGGGGFGGGAGGGFGSFGAQWTQHRG